MRIHPLLFAVVLPVLPALAQDETDNAIHAVTTLHEDGTKTVTITDPEKHSSESTTYNAAEKLLQKIIFVLDDANQPATGVVYNAADKPIFKTAYKHDELNHLTEEDDYTMDDQLLRRFVYEYGADGKVSGIRAYDGQGNEMQQTDARKDLRQSLPRIH